VVELGDAREGAVELSVDIDGRAERALAYPVLVGTCDPGDRVLLNTTAVDLELGTGGLHLVVAVDREPADAEQGYTIAKERYYLPEIRFTAEEITALAVAARSGADTAAEDAVRKLLSGATEGILATLPSDVGPVTETATETLTAAAEAVAGSRRVRFAYRTASGASAERTVDAYGLAVRGGHWYLVGLDHDRDEIRSFRLSRVASSLTEDGQAEPPPEGFRASDHVRTAPWGPGDGEGSATVAFAPDVAWWATTGIAGVEDLETSGDGWSVVRLPATPGESLAAWVLSFGPAAEVLEPPELRDEVVRRLGSAVGA